MAVDLRKAILVGLLGAFTLGAAAPAAGWISTQDVSPKDDSPLVQLQLEARNATEDNIGFPTIATLIIQCKENRTSLIIDFNVFLGIDPISVTTRIDKDKAETRKWGISTNRQAAGLWNGSESIPFIRKLVGRKQLFVQVTPYGKNPMDLFFDIGGLGNHIQDVAVPCGWTLTPKRAAPGASREPAASGHDPEAMKKLLEQLQSLRKN